MRELKIKIPNGFTFHVRDNEVLVVPDDSKAVPKDAIALPNVAHGTKLSRCIAWLREVLDDGWVLGADIMQRGAKRGFNRNTIYRAKLELGVVDAREGPSGRANQWALPEFLGVKPVDVEYESWLRNFLARYSGNVEFVKMIEAAKADGLSVNRVQRTRRQLGIPKFVIGKTRYLQGSKPKTKAQAAEGTPAD